MPPLSGSSSKPEEQPSVSRLLKGTSRFIYAILAGSSLVYLAIVLNKIYLAFQYVPISESHHYIAQLLSSYIVPLLAGQGVFFLAVYFEWQRKKRALLAAHREELRKVREEAALQSTQKVVGFISEHVTAKNAEILKWVQFRKNQNQQVSARVDEASHSIARAMQALTEFAFVYPYVQKQVQPVAPARNRGDRNGPPRLPSR
jgi:hypothetical protein